MAFKTKYNNNLPLLNKQIKTLSINMSKSSEQLKTLNNNLRTKNLNSVDNLIDRQISLKNAISETTKQAVTLNDKYNEMTKQNDIDPNQLLNLKVLIVNVKNNLTSLNAEFKKTNQEISKIKGNKFLELSGILGNLGNKMLTNFTLPINKIASSIIKLTTSTIKEGNEISKTADKLGISAQSLQQFKFIAESSGVSFDILTQSFNSISQITADISKGINNNATVAFRKLGISVNDANGKVKSSDAIFLNLQTALANISDQGTKNNLIFEIFGQKAGTDLKNVLTLSNNEMTKLINSTQDLGFISNDSAKKSEELTSKLVYMKQKIYTLKIEIATSLFPVLENIINFINKNIIPSISAIVTLFTNLSNNTKQWIITIAGVISAAGPALILFSKIAGIFETLITVFNLARVAVTAFGVSFDIATAGIAVLIAVFAGLLLKNEEFRSTLGVLINMLMTLLQPVLKLVNILMMALKPALSFVVSILNMFVPIVAKVASAIVQFLITPFNFLIKIINAVIKGINLLLQGLKIITFGRINLQIPEIPSMNTNANLNGIKEQNSNSIHHNSIAFTNNFQITKEADANKIVAIVNNQLGNTLR